MLNLELLAQGGDHSIVKVRTIISDNPFWDTVSVNEILLDEAATTFLVMDAKEATSTHFVK